MQVVRGLALGVAVGAAVAVAVDVQRPVAVVVCVVAVLLFLVLTRAPGAGGTAARVSRRRQAQDRSADLGHPTSFFTGRRLADALAWLGQEHGVTTLAEVQVYADLVLAHERGPHGPRVWSVADDGGAFTVDRRDLPSQPGDPSPYSGRFHARDLAPDVLPRILGRARRERPGAWTDLPRPAARIAQPDRLFPRITVQVANDPDDAEAETAWATADGELLYLQRPLS